jgi:hypothetical protein
MLLFIIHNIKLFQVTKVNNKNKSQINKHEVVIADCFLGHAEERGSCRVVSLKTRTKTRLKTLENATEASEL